MIETFKDLNEIQMTIFKLGNEKYAVPIMSIQEIIMPQKVTHIPKSPDWVEGVINLRGQIIPIIDARKKLQLEVTVKSTESRIMVLDIEHEVIGLIVDEVEEVIHLKTEDVEPTPVDMGEDSDFLWGVGKYQNGLLILINPEKFLSHVEANDLKKLAKVTKTIQQEKDCIKI